jgi:hypothetical protein
MFAASGIYLVAALGAVASFEIESIFSDGKCLEDLRAIASLGHDDECEENFNLFSVVFLINFKCIKIFFNAFTNIS